jgi:hypothetical protein
MIEDLTLDQYEAVLREDFASFVARCFYDLNPQADLAMNWHLEVIAAKLIEVRRGRLKWHDLSRGTKDRPEGKLDPQTLRVPSHDECWNDRLIPARRSAEEINDRDLMLHRIPEPAVIASSGRYP